MPIFWQTGAPHILKIQWFPLSILIFGQKSCFLGPTIFNSTTELILVSIADILQRNLLLKISGNFFVCLLLQAVLDYCITNCWNTCQIPQNSKIINKEKYSHHATHLLHTYIFQIFVCKIDFVLLNILQSWLEILINLFTTYIRNKW